MWDYTEKDDINIEGIYMWFLPKFPNIDKELLYKRIFTGYCWGEGGFRLTTIESWEEVFGFVEAPYIQQSTKRVILQLMLALTLIGLTCGELV